jgi:hypothetical protein
VTALTKIVDHILIEMDHGNYTGVLFFDFKQVFDMVNRTILLSKLKVYELDDLSLNWFRSYLSERSQKVFIWRRVFFQNLTLVYMTKTLNQIIFFSSTKIRIFFSAAFGKKTYPPPLSS